MSSHPLTKPLSFLAGTGEMVQLIAQKDWGTSPVGLPETWPQSLRTTLSIVLQSRFPMFLFWGPEHICFYNDAYRPSLGANGKHPYALGEPGETVWPETWPTIKPLIDQILAGGEATWSDDQCIPIYRNERLEDAYWTFSYSAVHDEEGQIAGVFVACTETTQAVLSRRRILENEQRLLNLFENAPVGIALLRGPEHTFELANSFYLQLVGRTNSTDIINKPLLEALPEIRGQGFDALLTNVVRTNTAHRAVEQPVHLTRNGQTETIYVDFVYQPLSTPDSGVFAVITDVTAGVLARQRVEESEKQLQNLLHQAPVAIAIFRGRDFVIDLVNERHLAFWNRSLADVLNRPVFEVIPEAAGQGYEQRLLNVLETGQPYQANEQYVELNRNGQRESIWVNLVYEPVYQTDTLTGQRQVTRVMEVIYEVTEQVLARQQIEASERQFRQLSNLVPQIIWTAQPDGFLDYYNQQWYDYTGFEEGYGDQSWLPILHPDDAQLCVDTWYHSVHTGEPYHIEYRFIDRQHPGQYRWFMGRAEPIHDETGQIIKWFGTCTDIHDQKTLNEQLERVVAERTESLRQVNSNLERSNLDLIQFASVASHDLKEPLRKIQTFGTRLVDQLNDRLKPDEADMFGRLINATARMQDLVSDVLRLSKLSDQTVSFRPVNLNRIVQQIGEDLELTIREQGAELLISPLPTVWAEPSQMHQLLLNLITNALKFHDHRPPIVRIEPVALTDELRQTFQLPSRNFAVLSVSDEGIGFDPKYRDKIFGMFQRLHGRSQYAGTGIGLTIVKKIVDNHGGRIDVQSEPGRGTTFRIALPTAN